MNMQKPEVISFTPQHKLEDKDEKELAVIPILGFFIEKLHPPLSSVKWSQVHGCSVKRLEHMKTLLDIFYSF